MAIDDAYYSSRAPVFSSD